MIDSLNVVKIYVNLKRLKQFILSVQQPYRYLCLFLIDIFRTYSNDNYLLKVSNKNHKKCLNRFYTLF